MDYEEQQQLTLPVVDVYQEIEEQILINVAKKLRRDKSLFTKENINSWQVEKLNELESLSQENVVTIAKHSGLAVDEVTKMLKKSGYRTVRRDEDDLQKAVQQGKTIETPPLEKSKALEAVLLSYQRQAKETFNLVNTTMLDQSQQAYRDIVNQTTGKVLAGVQTPQQALREVSRKWADMGIPALVDRAGKRWSTEAYVSMVTRSMSNNVANEMQDARMDEYGVDLIEVSSHAGARPKCAPYQGQIYSRSGSSDQYPPFSDTSYGLPDGLFGVNCGHNKYPFIPGVSKPRYKGYDQETNKRIYENSQKQRYLERRIRKAKREESMMKEMGDEEGAKMARSKVRERQAELRGFIDKTGRTRRRAREQIH